MLKDETTQSTALVVKSDDRIREFMRENHPSLGHVRWNGSGNYGSGYEAGKAAGYNVQLGPRARQLTGTRQIES
jgi:hypothetical protein